MTIDKAYKDAMSAIVVTIIIIVVCMLTLNPFFIAVAVIGEAICIITLLRFYRLL